MRRAFLALVLLLAFAGCAHHDKLAGPPGPEMFAPNDLPQGHWGPVSPADSHLRPAPPPPREPTPRTVPDDSTARMVSPSPPPPPSSGPGVDPLPQFGEVVAVEVPPEPIQRVYAAYPELAREAGIQGTVVVSALVRADGTVADVRVTKSIPMLDVVVQDAVRQWRFKPALAAGGRPVAVWHEVPYKFSLR